MSTRAAVVGRPRLAQIEPLHLLAAVFAAASLATVASWPLVDPDAPWHVLLGSQVWGGVAPWQAGRGWTFAPVDDSHWVTTQWLAELLTAGVHGALGWSGLLVFRALLTLGLLFVLAVTLLPGRPARASVPVFLIAAGPAFMVSVQERPQSLSFMLLVPVSWWALRIVQQARPPSAWVVVPLTVGWANTHGLWILLPATFTLAAVARWTDHGVRDRASARTLALVAASLASALVTPAGIGTLTAGWRFRKAAGPQITEWLPVNLIGTDAIPLVALGVVMVVAWSRGRVRPPRSELLYVGGLLLFGLSAYRNVTPALLLTAPFALSRITAAWDPQPSRTSERERRLLGGTIAAVVTVGLMVAIVEVALIKPFPSDAPVMLAEQVAGRPEGTRVLPEYNDSGLVLALIRPSGKTAIDGRSDLFGAAYIGRYGTLTDAGYGWQATLRELDPTSAILRRTTNLAKKLQKCGWLVEDSTPTHLLLVPTPGWSCPAGS
ncbi:MAG TPA: hypothetical protein VIM19_00280 [Actinomycetes bacterium]